MNRNVRFYYTLCKRGQYLILLNNNRQILFCDLKRQSETFYHHISSPINKKRNPEKWYYESDSVIAKDVLQ